MKKDHLSESQILQAIKNNDINKLNEWLEDKKLDVNLQIKNEFNHSLSMIATYEANLETLQWLVENGANLNVKNQTDLTALEIAVITCHKDQKEKITYLLKCGLDFEHEDFRYCALGNLEQLKQWLIEHPNEKKADRHQQTLLHYAAACGQSEIVNYLLETQKVSMTAIDKWAYTPHGNIKKIKQILHQKSKETITLLLQKKDQWGYTPLLQAGRGNHLSIVKLFAQHNPKLLTAKNKYGNNLLLIAAKNGYQDIMAWCLNEKNTPYFNLTDTNKSNYTVLHWLAEEGHIKLIEWLLQNQPKETITLLLQKKDRCGYTPLLQAGRGNHLSIVKLFAQHNPKLLTAKTNNNNNLLHIAAANGYQEIMAWCLNEKNTPYFNLANLDGNKYTVLHWLAEEGHIKLIEWLLQNQPKETITLLLQKKDRWSYTPLLLAGKHNHLPIVKLFAQHNKKLLATKTNGSNNLLLIAAANRHQDIIKWCLNKENSSYFNLTDKGRNDYTTLHWLTQNGNIKLIESLLQNQPKETITLLLQKKDQWGYTPLLRAGKYNHLPIVKLFAQHNKKLLAAKDNDGDNLLLNAAANGHQDIIEWCLNKKNTPYFNLADKGSNDYTTLHWLAQDGHIKLIKSLLQNQPKETITLLLQKKDQRGYTPLLRAGVNNHLPIVKLFAQHNPKLLTAKDNDGDNLLLIAAVNGHQDIMQWCLNKENPLYFNLTDKGRSDYTTLHWLAQDGHIKLIKSLLQNQPEETITLLLQKKDQWGYTPLLRAGNENHLAIVKLFAQHNKKLLAAKNNDNNNLLLIAAKKGYQKIIEWCLNKENIPYFNLTDEGRDNYTTLHWLAQKRQVKLIEWLLQNQSKEIITLLLQKKDQWGYTPLLAAGIQNHLPIIKLFVKHSPKLLAAKNNYGDNLLLIAALIGHQKIIEWCLNKNNSPYFNLTNTNKNGYTVLHWLAKEGYIKPLEWLLQNQPKETITLLLQKKDQWGYTPLLRAGNENRLAVVKLFAQHNQKLLAAKNKWGKNLLLIAATNGYQDIIKFCLRPEISKYLNLTDQNNNGETALHILASKGYSKFLETFLERSKTRPNSTLVISKNRNRKNPWQIVDNIEKKKEYNYKNIKQLLEDAHRVTYCLAICILVGVKPFGKKRIPKFILRKIVKEINPFNSIHEEPTKSPLQAIKDDDIDELELWFQCDDVNINKPIKEECNRTPIMVAACIGNLKTLHWFFQKGADLNLTDQNGMNSLELAAIMGRKDQKEKINYLLDQRLKFEDKIFQYCALGNLELLELYHENRRFSLFKCCDKNQQTLLHYAAACNQQEIVINLIEEEQLSATVKDKWGYTPLLRAGAQGHFAIVNWLLDKDPKLLDAGFPDGCNILHWLIEKGHTEFIEWLLKHKNKKALELLREKDHFNNTPMLLATKCQQFEIIQLLSNYNPDTLRDKGLFDNNLLLIAAHFGYQNIMEWCLLPKNALYFNLKVKNKEGYTILHWLIQEGHTKCLQWLLTHKQKEALELLSQEDNYGNTPMLLAVVLKKLDIIQLLSKYSLKIGNPDNNNALVLAAFHGCQVVMEWCLLPKNAAYFNLKTKNTDGYTILHWIAQQGHIKLIDRLFKNKKNETLMLLKEKDNDGNTPMLLAVTYRQFETMQYLANYHSDSLKDKDAGGNNLLLLAACYGYPGIMWWCLLPRNAQYFNLNDKNKEGYTVPHWLARQGHYELLKWLLEEKWEAVKGLLQEKENVHHCTPLMLAEELGHKNIVKLLTEKSINNNSNTANEIRFFNNRNQNNTDNNNPEKNDRQCFLM